MNPLLSGGQGPTVRCDVQELQIHAYSAHFGWSHRKHTDPALVPLISLTPMSHTQLVGPIDLYSDCQNFETDRFPERKLR
jgi:hypothetical protein